MKYPETATPYTATYLIFRKAEKIALLLRKNTPWMNNYWGLPSGKVDRKGGDGSESFKAAGCHEGLEEVGVKIEPTDLKHVLTVHRNEPEEDMVWVDVYFEVTKWKGELYNAEPEIHERLDLFDPNNLPINIVPSVKAGIEAIENGKTYIEYGWEGSGA
ncbi:MAG TPA: NUDIX domain-containing protein [Candidatus Saccharimonadales bacterium]|nr:NUDIX domain-containing protein [Candidatus Saccharimonadales bacterium]